MRIFLPYWRCGLILGAALFALGPPQTSFSQKPAENFSPAATAHRETHAPTRLLLGPDGRPLRAVQGEEVSQNWSGYVVTSGPYTDASATWTVPSVAGQSGPEYSSAWVGIGGWNGHTTLIQLGTEQNVTPSGTGSYYAWYELLPAAQSQIINNCVLIYNQSESAPCTVNAGDVIQAGLFCTANCTAIQQTWALLMTNWTENWLWSKDDLAYAVNNASAEWIMEATETHIAEPLPNYNSVSFGGMLANGVQPMLSISANGIFMQDPAGGTSNPCLPNPGNGFVVVYGFSTNCPKPYTMLPGTGAVGNAQQGWSGALSADGNTAIVGGPADGGGVGAAWVSTRSSIAGGSAWNQQAKLVGTGITGSFSGQGASAALSSDGNTAIVGAPYDNYNLAVTAGVGAAWIFTRSGSTWTQQAKLIGSEVDGYAGQGLSVGLSDDGNVAVVGGPGDNNSTGAAWVYMGSGSSWSGTKLPVGTGAVGNALQGWSVAVSGDGDVVAVGGPFDNSLAGAVWVYTLNSGTWAQSQKLVATSAVGKASQGTSVALSADGTTLALGGPDDNSNAGAAWIFTRGSNGVWTQQAKLVGNGAIANAYQGNSVALSADGNTVIVGGVGGAWVFTRSNAVWTQLGSKLTGANANGTDGSYSVALSAAADTAILGGNQYNNKNGAAWVIVRQNPRGNLAHSHDFNGDFKSDILWRGTGTSPTAVAMWLMNGSSILGSGSVATIPSTYSIIGQRDFTGGGNADLLWRDTSGNLYMWLMNGATMSSSANLGNVPTTWTVKGTADMNGDGIGDVLWQDTAGDVAIWFMNGSTISSTTSLGTVPPASGWSIVAQTTGDILWSNTSSGALALWQVNGSGVQSSNTLGTVPSNWMVQGIGDFDGDGVPDILWRDNNSGTVAIWFMNTSGGIQSTATVGAVPIASTWNIVETGDYDGDGMSDILWVDGSGNVAMWFMTGATVASSVSLGNVGTGWAVQATNAE